MDFIPNHTSDKHYWFNQSQAGVEPYKDYYVWVDCKDSDHKPNNWVGTSFTELCQQRLQKIVAGGSMGAGYLD